MRPSCEPETDDAGCSMRFSAGLLSTAAIGLLAACGYSGPSVTISSEVEMRAPAGARCGDLNVSVTEVGASTQLTVNETSVDINSSDPVTRLGFSPGCDLAFVETFGADSTMREIRVVNLSTNAEGNSDAEDGTIVWVGGGSTFLDAFVSRDDTAWVLVWQDPLTKKWSVDGGALENEYHGTRLAGSITELDARPADVNLHIGDDGRPTHWLLAFSVSEPVEMELTAAP